MANLGGYIYTRIRVGLLHVYWTCSNTQNMFEHPGDVFGFEQITPATCSLILAYPLVMQQQQLLQALAHAGALLACTGGAAGLCGASALRAEAPELIMVLPATWR